MTNKLVGIALFAVLLMLAPLAAAEADGGNTTETSSGRPDDAAWVEDCPPDMMCAASTPDEGAEENVTRGEDCESCRYDEGEDCIHCSSGPTEDNTTWGTDCPPGVQCMVNGETEDPDDAGWVDCGGEICAYDTDTPATEEASALGAYGFLGALALVGLAFVATFRRD